MTSNTKSNPPFRAEHIGSLLRPHELIEAHRSLATGKLTAEGFRAAQENLIRDVIRLQEEAGLQAVTDGEFRRGSYFSHFIEAVTGITDKEAVFHFTGQSGKKIHFHAPHIAGKLKRERGISTEEFRFLQGNTQCTPKITMPSPSTMHFFRCGEAVEKSAYADEEEFFADLVRVYREEVAELVSLGLRYLQIDEVPLAMLCDPKIQAAVRSRGKDPELLREKYIALVNAIVKDKPEQLTVGMHLCRGNYKASWLSEGSYEAVADHLFNNLNVDAFFLEYDGPRAGDFSPLQYMPSNKTVVLGLVSSKTPDMEQPDLLKKRVDEASRFVPLERLAISPQCGFGTSVGSRPVTLDVEKQKLRLVVDTARQIWG